MKKQVENWLHYSKVDLVTIEKIQSAAFHCHQAVEKALKALIANQNQKVPKTHDLVALFGITKKLHSNLSISTAA